MKASPFILILAFFFFIFPLSCTEKEESIPVVVAALSNETIVFNSEQSGTYQIFKSLNDGTQAESLTEESGYDFWWPRVSPDRKQILFYKAAEADNQNYSATSLWVMNSDGSNKTRLMDVSAHGWTLNAHAEWSPDSSKILMCAGIGGVLHIATTNSDGTNPQQLTSDGNWNCDPSWSPNGDKIIFNRCTTLNCGGASRPDLDIFTMNADGTNLIQLTNDAKADYDPYYSPDGSQIAWLRLEDPTAFGGVGRWSIRKMASDGSAAQNIIDDGFINSKPAWSLDGLKIFFHRIDGATAGKWQLFTINPDGSSLEKLNLQPGINLEYPTN